MEELNTEGYGPGWIAPANERQPFDLILFDKKAAAKETRRGPRLRREGGR